MAILTRSAILDEMEKGTIRISEFNQENLGPNSYDVTLGNKLKHYLITPRDNNRIYGDMRDEIQRILDPKKENPMKEIQIPNSGYVLEAGKLYLASVNEQIWSDRFVFELQGKSSLARMGLTVHVTASYSNLGHDFKYVLEMYCLHDMRIYPNMKIAQIYLHTTYGDCESYDGNFKDAQKGSEISGPLIME